MFCVICGAELDPGSKFCKSCGSKVSGHDELGVSTVFSSAAQTICDAAGVRRIKKFSFAKLMSEAFSKHTREEFESHVFVGTRASTPPIQMLEMAWPRPWLFARCFFVSLLLFAAFSIGFDVFDGNPNLIPGMLLLGNVVVPLSIALFFFEINVWKNISLVDIVRYVVMGGVVSILVSLLFFRLYSGDAVSSAVAGFIEEPGKLLALIVLSRRDSYRYKLNGLVLGASIGTGFAILESMGYSLGSLLAADTIEEGVSGMKWLTFFRGVFSLSTHAVWTAIAGCALWRVQGGGRFHPSQLLNAKFLRLFAISVVCHMVWNGTCESSGLLFLLIAPMILILSWLIVFSLVQEGIQEVGELKELRAGKESTISPDESSPSGNPISSETKEWVCPSRGGTFLIPTAISVGQHIQCPHCNAKFSHQDNR